MRYGCYILLLSTLIGGCNLFKNTSNDSRKTHQSSVNELRSGLSEQKDWLNTSSALLLSTDTLDLQYKVQIWPQGMFSFSPEKGFSGKAAQVLIRGSTQKVSFNAVADQSQQQDKGKIQENLSQQQKEVNNLMEKRKMSSPSMKWMLIGLLVMLVAGWYSYRKITGKLMFKN